MHPVRVGTCGWSYKEWQGVFYPKKLPAGDFLTSYARHYPAVEVDNTFYRIPSARMVEGWRDKTPAGFGFSLKVPRVITHEKVLLDCRDEVEEFVEAVRLLGDKLLICLLQFGFFNRSVFPTPGAFVERLDRFLETWPKDVPVAVEVRNKDWVAPPLADCLRRHRVSWALADQAWMPSPKEVLERLDPVTGPWSYLRMLGDRKEVEKYTTTFNHTVLDLTELIEEDAAVVRTLAERVPVLVFVNNHFAGYAPETIREFQQALGRLTTRAPGPVALGG